MGNCGTTYGKRGYHALMVFQAPPSHPYLYILVLTTTPLRSPTFLTICNDENAFQSACQVVVQCLQFKVSQFIGFIASAVFTRIQIVKFTDFGFHLQPDHVSRTSWLA